MKIRVIRGKRLEFNSPEGEKGGCAFKLAGIDSIGVGGWPDLRLGESILGVRQEHSSHYQNRKMKIHDVVGLRHEFNEFSRMNTETCENSFKYWTQYLI